jgi:hypothetical protein
LDPETHELFIEHSVQFEESSPSSSSHLPSSTTDSDSDSEDFPPATSTHRVDHEVSSSSSQSSDSEDEDSPPPSPTMPRWARQTLESAGTLVGDPSDTRRTHHNIRIFHIPTLPQLQIHSPFMKHQVLLSGIQQWRKSTTR